MDFKIILQALIRHLISVAAGALVAKGVIDNSAASSVTDALATVTTGGILAGGSYVWSVIDKKNR